MEPPSTYDNMTLTERVNNSLMVPGFGDGSLCYNQVMQIEYGPAGHRGVTQIMGLGTTAVDVVEQGKSLVPRGKEPCAVGALAALMTIAGAILGSSTVRNIGIGGVGAIVLTKAFQKSRAAQTAAPSSIQGWG